MEYIGHICSMSWFWYLIWFQCNVSSKEWIIDLTLTLTYLEWIHTAIGSVQTWRGIQLRNRHDVRIPSVIYSIPFGFREFMFCSRKHYILLTDMYVHLLQKKKKSSHFLLSFLLYGHQFFFTYIHLHSSKDLIRSTCDIGHQMKHKIISISIHVRPYPVMSNISGTGSRYLFVGTLELSWNIISFSVFWIVQAARNKDSHLRRRIW